MISHLGLSTRSFFFFFFLFLCLFLFFSAWD